MDDTPLEPSLQHLVERVRAAAEAGLASLHFCNVVGRAPVVVPAAAALSANAYWTCPPARSVSAWGLER